MVRKAVANNFLAKDPFMSVEGKQAKSHRTFLTKHELEAVQTKTFGIERFEKVNKFLGSFISILDELWRKGSAGTYWIKEYLISFK